MTNGTIILPEEDGTQVTGRPGTSILNTLVRAKRALMVDAVLISVGEHVQELPICAGDDGAESPTPGREECYEWFGYPLRDAEVSDELEFCSFNFEGEPFGIRSTKPFSPSFSTSQSPQISLQPLLVAFQATHDSRTLYYSFQGSGQK